MTLSKLLNLASWLVAILVVGSIFLPQMIRILREYQRGVIFRLGKLIGAKGPGLVLLIPFVDRMVRMDLRVVTIDVAKQEAMTRDNVPVTVDAVEVKACAFALALPCAFNSRCTIFSRICWF